MGVLDRILNNKTISVLNRLAPILSASILSAYVMAGRRVSIVVDDGAHKELVNKYLELGGG